MPLPLYGSGLRTARTSAANWPTCLLVGALDHDVRLVGQVTVRPVGNRLVNFVGKADAKLQHVLLRSRAR